MREQIFLSKNYTVIESDIPFTLKFNIKDNTAASAEDIINFKSGWYIFDNNKLLPQYVDGIYNLPKYNCWIEYNVLPGCTKPRWYTCYINPKSVESLSAEQTELDPAQLALIRQDVQINGSKVDSFAVATHEDLGAVKSSVDALKSSTHTDISDLSIGVLAKLAAIDVTSFKCRNLLSPNPLGFNPSWDNLVCDLSLGSYGGIFLPFDCCLMFRFFDSGFLVSTVLSKYFKAGCYDVYANNGGDGHAGYWLSISGIDSFVYDFPAIISADNLKVFSHKIENL